MSKHELFTMPHWQCPLCGQEFFEEEYYQLDPGDVLECTVCERDFKIIDKEVSIDLVIEVP